MHKMRYFIVKLQKSPSAPPQDLLASGGHLQTTDNLRPDSHQNLPHQAILATPLALSRVYLDHTSTAKLAKLSYIFELS